MSAVDTAVGREDVARVRDGFRRLEAHMAAHAANAQPPGAGRAAAEGISSAYGAAADSLDSLLGEDTRPDAGDAS